ncbi:hypothetical protein C2845_PM09G02680 [Panicum miliaceum]|uniref:DUF676 domain-containing protein n=1 Tax=Panicum miliaceum TaxID=4540 RepID=A0A3L6RZE4_PANMI|nr:hypothetical protein C2845_PM09G02680 [Panicum miliaceum]
MRAHSPVFPGRTRGRTGAARRQVSASPWWAGRWRRHVRRPAGAGAAPFAQASRARVSPGTRTRPPETSIPIGPSSPAESKGCRDADANGHHATPRPTSPANPPTPSALPHAATPARRASAASSAAFLDPVVNQRHAAGFVPCRRRSTPRGGMASTACSLPHGHSPRGSYSSRSLRFSPVGPACSSCGSGTPSGCSPKDWTYGEAVLKRRLGDNFFIYDMLLQYSIRWKQRMKDKSSAQIVPAARGSAKSRCTSGLGAVAGLEPINFITLATPHLGVRGRNQLPFLQGLSILEKLAVPLAPLIVGRTGAQLFLTDGDPSKPPLLLQMASDCEDKKFIMISNNAYITQTISASILVLCFLELMLIPDMVGWRTSSPSHRSLDGYKHIVNVEYCLPVSSEGPHFPSEAARAKEAAQRTPNTENTEEYHQMMEEEMTHGLQKVGWKKVDVNFHSSFWPYLAHNNIHVKSEWLHNAGAGVIVHVADSIKQQESRPCLPANL